MPLQHSLLIEVKQAAHKGRGVFARQPIQAGDEIERVPVIVIPRESVLAGALQGGLADYCFVWDDNTVAVALGYGSLYNHSYEPNARYDDVAPRTKVYRALRDIQPGEEITVNYNGTPEDRSDVGFPVV